MNKRRVVITGMGIVSPIGTGLSEFEDSLFEGKSGIQHIQELEDLGFSCCIGGLPEINNSPYIDLIDRFNLKSASSIIQYALIAAAEAWKDGGLIIPDNTENLTDYSSGVIIGSGMGAVDQIGNQVVPHTLPGKRRRLRSTVIEQCMPNGASAHVALMLGLGNRVSSCSSACATSTEAIITAAERIANGQATRMLAGGTESYSPFGWIGFDIMRVLNRGSNHDPQRGSMPLSENANGFIPGAGSGIILLEEYESAKKRGAKIYAEYSGGFINSGGLRNGGSMTAPSSEAVIQCITSAIKDAGISAKKIDYIAGHLSSTMADVLEIKNISKALNRKGKNFPYINSIKAQTGHCIGAGGAIETIGAIIQMQRSTISAAINSRPLNKEIENLIDPKCIPETNKTHKINYILKPSFGFGDVNASIVLKNLSI